jgi:hypothetical protein
MWQFVAGGRSRQTVPIRNLFLRKSSIAIYGTDKTAQGFSSDQGNRYNLG